MGKETGFEQVSPWVNLFREIDALFEGDNEVEVGYVDADRVINLYVENQKKAEALAKLLPVSRTYGNETVYINVIMPNNKTGMETLFTDAFDGNKAFSRICTGSAPFTDGATFVVFEPDIVQYKNDNLFDINGNRTTVYEDIARDVFEIPNVFFNTEEV